MNEASHSDKLSDLVEQHAMIQEYVNNAMSTFIPHLIPAFKDLIENKTPSLAKEFYEDVNNLLWMELFRMFFSDEKHKQRSS